MTRRDSLKSRTVVARLALGIVLGVVSWPASVFGQIGPPTVEPNIKLKTDQQESGQGAKAVRRKALNRRRRVIFNDDTYELSRADANTPEGFLKRRLKPLVSTHVDTIAWSILGGWADAPVYDSKVQPIYGDAHGAPPAYWNAVTKNVKALIASGHCPLQIVIEFAHENDMELFASVRMNDCHDSFIPGGVTLWKKAHPEFLIDPGDVPRDKDKHPLGLYVIAQNWSHKEVRDRKFEIIEEVCRRYDIDGVNLNYIRHPVFFNRTMRGLPVTDKETKIMTAFMRRIRRLTEAAGARRGRPILISAIVPDNLRLARNVGLDVETWIEEDLIDMVTPGLGYAPFSLPVTEFTELAHKHGVKVYPCINRKAPQHVADSAVSEGFRGVATNWYCDGADGLFFWNLGTPFEFKTGDELVAIRNRYYAALPHLGDPAEMKYRDKLFCVDDRVLSYYQHVTSTPPLPAKLEPGKAKRIPFTVGDDVRAAEKDGRLASLKLALSFEGEVNQDTLALRLNGEVLTGGRAASDDKRRVEYDLNARLVNHGKNTLEASLKNGAKADDAPRVLSRLRLWVRYKRVALPIPKRKTGKMGGVAHPTKADLLAMHQGDYILHARGGKLAKIPVEKTRLPGDPGKWTHQGIRVARTGDGTVYVKLRTRMCKSVDDGRTWNSYQHDGQGHDQIQILKDGTFVSIGIPHVKGEPYWSKPAEIWSSDDEGKSWNRIARIDRPESFGGVEYEWWYATYPLHRLPDDTLLWAVQIRNTKNTKPPYKKRLVMYRSTDGGRNWKGPRAFAEWSSEGGMTRTASGKLLAVVRYQRNLLPDDPPDLCDGRTWGGCRFYPWLKNTPYKHAFLIESDDEGHTWKNFRQLTTTLGQCYGFPLALQDRTVVVVHTTPYGPGERGSRAIISHDDGKTWQDEVYYLTFSEESGYNQSVTLDDGKILTIAARNDTEPYTAICWKPSGIPRP